MKLKAILAVDEEFGIGIDNKLAWHNPEDLKEFQRLTLYNIVVMGRNTFLSLKRPLKNRVNIIISGDADFKQSIELLSKTNPEYKHCIVASNVKDLIKNLRESQDKRDAFIIGGRQIYEQLLFECDEIYVSLIDGAHNCNVFFNFNTPFFEQNYEATQVKNFNTFTQVIWHYVGERKPVSQD